MPRPWRVDHFDVFKERIFGSGDRKPRPHKRALLFVNNSGADTVLGMLLLARELLRRGTAVVMVANSHPALNDVMVMKVLDIVVEAAKRAAALGRQFVIKVHIYNSHMLFWKGCDKHCIQTSMPVSSVMFSSLQW